MDVGTVKWFDSKKGFGFIKGPQEGHDIFVHYTSIEGDGFRSLKNGETVEYELVESDKGLQAQHVRPHKLVVVGKPGSDQPPAAVPMSKPSSARV